MTSRSLVPSVCPKPCIVSLGFIAAKRRADIDALLPPGPKIARFQAKRPHAGDAANRRHRLSGSGISANLADKARMLGIPGMEIHRRRRVSASDRPLMRWSIFADRLIGAPFDAASMSSTGHDGAGSPEQRETVSARIFSSLARSASFARTSSRCACAISLTSAQDARDGSASARSARICSMLNPSSRARRIKASRRIWPSS